MQLSSTGVITTATWNGATVTVPYGGTGLTTLTAGYIPYGNGTGAFSSSANLIFDGNDLGVGVTPSTNSLTGSGYKSLEVGNVPGAGLFCGGYEAYLNCNTYYNSGFKYANTSYATQYAQTGGKHIWNIAPSGTAGNSISFTQAMTLFNSGGLSIGNTTDPGATNLSVTGNVLIGTSTSGVGRLQIVASADSYAGGGATLKNTAGNYWTLVTANSGGGGNYLYLGFNGADRGYFNSTTGVYTSVSDKDKKKDFELSNLGLNAVMQLKPMLYRMLDDNENTEKELGFIAQDVKDVIPQAYSEKESPNGKFIGIQDRPIIAVLAKAIQEQQQIIEQLKQKIGL
jgi:hypothetical protein